MPTEAETDPTLAAERQHLQISHDALAEMRGRAEQITNLATDELTAFALGRARARRLASLADDPTIPPFFGRIDGSGNIFHIGRRHVRDEENEPLVIDWRAPVARPFYRATVREPLGVDRRRRFGFARGVLTSYEDEFLAEGESGDSRILREEIERPRVGPMRDIVATIQPDQDDIVRSPIEQSICVQGAPGTGKTAVGLHRAAYLLYTYAEQLRRSGVLVVGPNRAFLGYIGAVLPALGEVGVTQVTVDELVEGVEVRAVDEPETALLKGDARMAKALRRVLYRSIKRPVDTIVVAIGSRRYRVPPERLRRYIDDLWRGEVRYAVARERLRALISADIRRQREAYGQAPSDRETARIGRSAPVQEAVDYLWPARTAADVVAEFLTEPSGRDFSEEELALLRWDQPPASVKRARWSAADAFLLDEVADLLDRVPGFGHVVLDEAQDLSPMQCRAVGRRALMGSVTVLGDIAQGTTPWAAPDWARTLEDIGKPAAVIEHLTAGYRVPAAVLQIANRLLPHLAPGLEAATAVRTESAPVRFGSRAALLAEIEAALAVEGSVGLIVPDVLMSSVEQVLRDGAVAVDVYAAEVEEETDARVALVPASVVKGLEFDHVILLEPAQIATGPRGLNRLYVALTRAVSRLVVLHDQALPEQMLA
ncbi:MAG TPA: ATP-binding domain-containing protein [Mycobacteriales bacterium]|nr:ATP-binding domain-containing protein [Mycobacteriales bacterium]